ncbi:phage holin family protein [Streptomyces alboflavus]|uniref:phage holin family protein n=1 Tax=Streptomyces alboflavus TaxID=67267 RepID=UPI0036A750C9
MTVTRHNQSATPPGPVPAREDTSIGSLISDITSDLSHLMRDEIELAKAELKQEATKAGKAAGLYGGAGYAAALTVLLATLTAVFALAHVMGLAWAALVMTGLWAAIGAVLYVNGRNRMHSVQPTPERSLKSLKEDAKWARHPTS